MRVALVIERFLPGGGGMEGVAWNVAHGLAEAGDEVHVVARDAVESNAVRVRAVRVPYGWQPLRVARFSRAAADVVSAEAFDVVHAFSRTLLQDVYRAGGGSHADYMDRAYSSLGRAARKLSPRHVLLLSLERRIFGTTRFIQCGSAMVRNEIATRFGVPAERLRVIQNGVDCERFSPAGAPAPPADLPARAGDAPVFLFAGSGWPRKGLDTALRALAATERRDARLWVAGGDDPRRWRALAARLGVAERVDFLGPRADLERVLAAADALLLPTRYDAFANVCLEAAAAGRAVVTSGANGSSEVVRDAGFVVEDPEDVAGFARALDRLCDPAKRSALGSRGREAALGLSWEAHVEKLRALYAEVGR